jgi:hypothetical protein
MSMRIVARALGGLWLAFSVVATLVTSFYAFLFWTINPTPWNFPGDPPLFDTLLMFAIANAVIICPLWLIAQFSRLAEILSPFSFGAALVACYWTVCVVICLAGIIERHDSRWREIRTAIRERAEAIAADAGNRRHVLTDEESLSLRERHVPKPIYLSLRGWGPVHLRMAHGAYPYVAIDFGHGRNALFDPTTMFCTYSD